jgi:aminopeptidase N
VRAPAGRTVVANGKLVSTHAVRDPDGVERVESVWRESRRIPVYLMVIAAAPLEQFNVGDTACGLAELQRCVPQSVYTAPEQRGFLPGPFARVGEIVQLFSNLVGPFPYEKLSHLQSSTRFGGMENASAIFYSDAGFRRHSMTDDVVAHETAHQWFGDAVTERDWPHLWLSEGFATYFAALWARAARGDSAFRVQMSGIRDLVLADTTSVPKRPVIDTIETNLLALLNRNSYQKGGFVLHMLRAQVGERAFFDAVRGYYAKHRHATAVTDDLRAEMERASRQKLEWFFDQWLRRPGYPEATATWSYDAATHDVVIRVTQGARFGGFQFPVTVAAIDSAGVAHRATAQMTATTGAQLLRIPLAAPPAGVVLDPDVELLAALRVVHE